MISKEPTINEAWNYFLNNNIATSDELILITKINGYKLKTLEDVLYVRTGFTSFEQI